MKVHVMKGLILIVIEKRICDTCTTESECPPPFLGGWGGGGRKSGHKGTVVLHQVLEMWDAQ